jgi:hypothetical protein
MKEMDGGMEKKYITRNIRENLQDLKRMFCKPRGLSKVKKRREYSKKMLQQGRGKCATRNFYRF